MKRFATTLVVGILPFLPVSSADEVNSHFIDVGQGDCTLVQSPNGWNLLIDDGILGSGDRNRVREYIRTELGEAPRVDVLVVTHPDQDNYRQCQRVYRSV